MSSATLKSTSIPSFCMFLFRSYLEHYSQCILSTAVSFITALPRWCTLHCCWDFWRQLPRHRCTACVRSSSSSTMRVASHFCLPYCTSDVEHSPSHGMSLCSPELQSQGRAEVLASKLCRSSLICKPARLLNRFPSRLSDNTCCCDMSTGYTPMIASPHFLVQALQAW